MNLYLCLLAALKVLHSPWQIQLGEVFLAMDLDVAAMVFCFIY